jgi:TolB-like protein/Flp pilus assembly protein TadD
LPFATRGTEDDTGSFADGMHDDLLTTLSGIGGLKAISRTSVLQYRDTTKNLRQIGQELGAANLLEGSVHQIGDQVRINVQLISVSTDEHLWAQTYDRELSVENLFEIQSEIAQTIAEALSVTLPTDERERIQREPTDNLEAFYAYNRGKQLFVRSTFESLQESLVEFERALEIDQQYVLASTALARTHSMLARTGAITVEEMLREGRPAIDRAIALNPDNPYALAVLGSYQLAADEPGFEETFDRAVELGPNIVEVLDIYASFLSGHDRHAEAIGVIERALDLDSLSTSLFHDLGRTLIALGNFDEAMKAFERISQLDPENPYAAHGSGLAAILGGKLPEAAYWSDKASEFDPADCENQATSTFIYMSYGDIEMATTRAEEALALGPGEPFPLAAKAYMLTVTGDREGAVRVARTALAKQLDDRWRFQFVFLRVMRDEAIESGDSEEAFAWYRQLNPELFVDPPEVNSANVQKAVDLAHLLQLAGDSGRAETILESAIAAYDQRYAKGAANFPLGVSKAEALALLGRGDEAIDSLRLVVKDGWRLMWRWDTQFNRNFDSIRDDPRFVALQNEIEADLEAQLAAFQGKPQL